MNLHFMQSVSSRPSEGSHRSSLRNPDGFFPERDQVAPDPLGVWLVRRIEAIADWIDGHRSARQETRAIRAKEVSECLPSRAKS